MTGNAYAILKLRTRSQEKDVKFDKNLCRLVADSIIGTRKRAAGSVPLEIGFDIFEVNSLFRGYDEFVIVYHSVQRCLRTGKHSPDLLQRVTRFDREFR